jgi:bifunctional UDP-N-acetylglucosamine pyrophosphorylase/glucosamine-1-phosphate N-acetyltransferase
MTDLLSIILAAGEGTRMRSDTPKLLHKVAGLPIIGHVVRAATDGGASRIAVVTGPNGDTLRETVLSVVPEALFFEQAERRGTGHAAAQAEPAYTGHEGYVAVVYGDHPLLKGETFRLISDRLDAGLHVAILGFEPEDTRAYGRMITDGDKLLAIREHKDATEEEREIGLCNACILGFRAEVFRELIGKIGPNNAQGEFYITDMVELANQAGYSVGYAVAPADDVMGVNSRSELAEAEVLYQERLRAAAMAGGVTLLDPASTFFSYDTVLGRDITIEPNVFIGPRVTVADRAVIRAFSHIAGDGKGSISVGAGAVVGPFARLRPGSNLASGAHVGNFVEIKNAEIGAGAKVNHLTYIGDAEVGAGSNIGAGTITCNYDGVNKHLTVIGRDTFIGSNSALVAPVTIGDGAYIASGSVVTRDVEPGALAVARGRQENKPGYAAKLKARAEAIKNQKK